MLIIMKLVESKALARDVLDVAAGKQAGIFHDNIDTASLVYCLSYKLLSVGRCDVRMQLPPPGALRRLWRGCGRQQ
jgi:hypothetical protein